MGDTIFYESTHATKWHPSSILIVFKFAIMFI